MVKKNNIQSDQQLLEAMQRGDTSVVNTLYQQHRAAFFSWAKKKYGVADEQLADCWQETVIAFYLNVQEGKLTKLRSTIRTYLFSVGKNVLLKQFRKNARLVNTDAVEGFDFIEDESVQVESSYDLNPKQEKLQRAFQKLGDNCRTILIFFYYRGFDLEEISIRMNYANMNTVKTRKFKCMARLEKLLKEL